MAKSKWQLEQEERMDTYRLRMAARHARHARKRGGGNIAEGVRILIEEDAEGFVERRKGAPDRRRK
jgi:hypothetical protein